MDGDGGVSNGSCYYSLLGIRNNASAADIRSAYRKLALKWHPDRWAKDPTAAGEAKRRFQRIQEAYFEQRKLGYMSLGRFKQALESSRKKDALHNCYFHSRSIFHTVGHSTESILYNQQILNALSWRELKVRRDGKVQGVKNNILEFLLSFYASSISDPESKILILQTVARRCSAWEDWLPVFSTLPGRGPVRFLGCSG